MHVRLGMQIYSYGDSSIGYMHVWICNMVISVQTDGEIAPVGEQSAGIGCTVECLRLSSGGMWHLTQQRVL